MEGVDAPQGVYPPTVQSILKMCQCMVDITAEGGTHGREFGDVLRDTQSRHHSKGRRRCHPLQVLEDLSSLHGR